MATESLLSDRYTILSMQRALLGEDESQYHHTTSGYALDGAQDIDRVTEQQSQSHSAAPDSLPQLPSTVPESQFQSNVASQPLRTTGTVLPQEPVATMAQKVLSQASDAPTDELTPTYYDGMIRSHKEQSVRDMGQSPVPLQDWENEFEEPEEEQNEDVSQHKGDPGFIDLTSSFGAHKEPANEDELGVYQDDVNEYEDDAHSSLAEDEENTEGGPNTTEVKQVQSMEEDQPEPDQDSPPLHFSPSQSQPALSQWPASQKFKTPATAGKKRDYSGQVIDSPRLPRNPFMRGGLVAPAPAMQLSQAFAATQANTSPFLTRTNGELTSDRPSPNLSLQPLTRPRSAISSSPSLLPISSVKRRERAETEPLDNYVSSKESQARREEALRREMQEDVADIEDDDLALEEDSWLLKENRARERDRILQQKLAFSSPPISSRRRRSLSNSSPVPLPSRRSPIKPRHGRIERTKPDTHPSKVRESSQVTESEDETDHELENDAGPDSNRHMRSPDEEDKENFSRSAIHVPATTANLQRIVGEPLAHVQESPLTRYGQKLYQNGDMGPPNSSQAFAVADSQPERITRRAQPVTQVPKSSDANEGIDRIPQSPESSPRPTVPVNDENLTACMPIPIGQQFGAQQSRTVVELPGAVEHTPATLGRVNSTVPETSSDEQHNNSGDGSKTKQQVESNESRSDFETARSHLQLTAGTANAPSTVDSSSPPISTSPPGKRRKLMAAITADPSPLKSQISFDAGEALEVDPGFLDNAEPQSPTRSRSLSGRRRQAKVPGNVDGIDAVPRAQALAEHESDRMQDIVPDEDNDADQQRANQSSKESPSPEQAVSHHPRRERKPTAKALSARKVQPVNPLAISRASQYDLPVSPAKKVISTSITSTKLKRKAEEAKDTYAEQTVVPEKRQRSNASKKVLRASTLTDLEHRQQPTSYPLPTAEPAGIDVAVTTNAPANDAEHVDGTIVSPNMVFAVFNSSSRAYYPALCHGRIDTDSNRFRIKWPGYTELDIVDEHGVRSLDLQIGDQVKIDLDGFPKVSHVIRGFKDVLEPGKSSSKEVLTDVRGHQTLIVAPKQRKNLPADVSTDAVRQVPVSAIYLDSNMWVQMKDRVYEHKPILVSRFSTPAELPSSPSTPPSRSRRGTAAMLPASSPAIDLTGSLFSNMAFMVSFGDDEAKKEELSQLVRENGGTILNDAFADILEPESMQIKSRFSTLAFTALLTDTHSRRPKYLQALALGLPCLSWKWVEQCIHEDKLSDWSSYLLAAGECTAMDGATKSRILHLPPGIEDVSLQNIIAARPQILAGHQVVVSMGKRKDDEEKRNLYLSCIRALAPDRLEVEPDLKRAKTMVESASEGDDPIDYLFVDKKDVQTVQKLFFPVQPAEQEEMPKTRRKSKSKQVPTSTRPESTKEEIVSSSTLKVRIMCKEDLVQSMILGKLWIGS